MWFIILWLALGIILLVNARIKRSWINGQTAFTGMWFASLTALWASPTSWAYISREASLIIISAHFFFFVGGFVASDIFGTRERSIPGKITEPENYRRISNRVFWPVMAVGLLGSWFTATSTGAFASYEMGDLLVTRSLLFTEDIQIPVYQRFMSNLLYPGSLLGALCFVSSRRIGWSWLYLALPLAGIMLYSFALGGRGAIFIGGFLILWVLVLGAASAARVKAGRRNYWLIVILLGMTIGWYFTLIVSTRMSGAPFSITRSLYDYFIGPIPAFSEWLTTHPLSTGNLDFTEVSFIRELLRTAGISKARTIGDHVVYIPFQFNVFTHLAEHLRDFGISGALIGSVFLGLGAALLENKTVSTYLVGSRAVFYAYLSISLFADVGYLSVGWWLTLFTVVGIELYVAYAARRAAFVFPRR